MKTASITPSPFPWKFKKNAPECIPSFDIWDADDVMVGYLGHCRQPGQAEANARLISAAPSLLKALQAAQIGIREASYDRYAGAALAPVSDMINAAIELALTGKAVNDA